MKPLLLLLVVLLLPGCAFMGEVFEGDFDNQIEYEAAVIHEVNQLNLPTSTKLKLREELLDLWEKYSDIVGDHDNLREALKARIVSLLLGN